MDSPGLHVEMAEELRDLIKEHLKKSKRDLTDAEERFGTFGLFGSRGSGKTTVLNQLQRLLEEEQKHWEEDLPKLYMCWPALDCTTLPPDISVGVCITGYLNEAIRNSLPEGQEELKEMMEQGWKKLMDRYLPAHPQYRQLELSLAVTSSEFRRIAKDELVFHLDLRSETREWLTFILGTVLKDQYDYILVPLEDFDLGIGGMTGNVLSAFLNELNDCRLLFLALADEDQLEKRLSSSESENGLGWQGRWQKTTVRQLLSKLMPIKHRVHIEPWRPAKSLGFKPLRPQTSADSNQESADTRDLRCLLDRVIDKAMEAKGARTNQLRRRDMEILLPRYPRGLTELYRKLERLSESDFASADEALLRLTVSLADCRGEHQLARKLPIRPLHWWITLLDWSEAQLKRTRWDRIIHEVQTRSPIWALLPESGHFPFEVDHRGDMALWTEFLLNLSFRREYDEIRAFISRFLPLKERINSCAFEVTYTKDMISRLGRLAREKPHSLASSWIHWRKQSRELSQTTVLVGWAPLNLVGLEPLLYTPSALPEILADLAVPYWPVSKGANTNKVLPADIRSLFFLVQNIVGLPWHDIRRMWIEAEPVEGWPQMFLVLGVLCGGAYLKTLRACLAAEGEPDEALSGLFDSLPTFREVRDADAKVVEQCYSSMKEGFEALRSSAKQHPMGEACRTFFEVALEEEGLFHFDPRIPESQGKEAE